MKRMLDEFKAFALRGSVIDLAIGVIIGGAFNKIIGSLVSDIIMPLLNLLRPGDFAELFVVLRQGTTPGPYPSLAAAVEAGAVTWNIGSFLDAIIMFVLVAWALFWVVKAISTAYPRCRWQPPAAPIAHRSCRPPECASQHRTTTGWVVPTREPVAAGPLPSGDPMCAERLDTLLRPFYSATEGWASSQGSRR